MAPTIEIDGTVFADNARLVAELERALVGRTVTSLRNGLPDVDPDWSGHGTVTLVFDDGSELECGGWGYDAWGPTIDYTAPAAAPTPEEN